MGGGIYLSTQDYGVPKGSGLGTSSILSGACVKGIFEFLGQERTDAEIYDVVLGMEQIMSTGGGWQDQVGGLTEGIKLISTKPGIAQNLVVEKIEMPEEGKKELKEALSAEEYEMVTATSEFKIKWFFFGKDHAKESD